MAYVNEGPHPGPSLTFLVTGAAGFLGQHFTDALIREDAGHDIWMVDKRPHPYHPHDVMDIVEWLESDGGPDKVDVVLHFAAPVGGRVKIEGDPLFNADSLRIDSALYRWASRQEHKPLIVYPSSSAVYPVELQRQLEDGNRRLRVADFNPRDYYWGQPDEMYGFTKMAGEVLAWKAAQYGVSTLCIRPFSGYGPAQDFGYPVTDLALRAIETYGKKPLEVWGGSQIRDFVYVRDLVDYTREKIDECLESMARGDIVTVKTVNIATGIGTPMAYVARRYLDLLGYDVPVEGIGGKPMGVFARVGDPEDFYQVATEAVLIEEGLKYVLEDVRARSKGG